MNAPYTGRGTLRVNRGADLATGFLNVQSYAYDNAVTHGVRLVLSDTVPGGCAVDMVLNPEDAARLARLIGTLARAAMIKREAQAMAAPGKPVKLSA
jgi:hypothetical protein